MGCLVLSAVVAGEPPAAPRKGMDEFALFFSGKTKWQAGPPSLPGGARMAVLEGDPSKEGPFVFRLQLPGGYRVPPHTHAKAEKHFVWVQGETVLQFHGWGPWSIQYVNPADDPRHQKK